MERRMTPDFISAQIDTAFTLLPVCTRQHYWVDQFTVHQRERHERTTGDERRSQTTVQFT